MNIEAFAFSTTSWGEVEKTEHPGETGMAYWRTQFFGDKPKPIPVCEWLNILQVTLRIIGAVKVMSFYAWRESSKHCSQMAVNSL